MTNFEYLTMALRNEGFGDVSGDDEFTPECEHPDGWIIESLNTIDKLLKEELAENDRLP